MGAKEDNVPVNGGCPHLIGKHNWFRTRVATESQVFCGQPNDALLF